MEAIGGIGIILVALLFWWYFGKTLDNTAEVINTGLETGNKMAKRKLSLLDNEQKLNHIEELAKMEINEELVTKATENKALLEKLEV